MAHGHGDIGTKMWAWTWLLGASPYAPSFPNTPTLGLYLGPSFLDCPWPRALPGPFIYFGALLTCNWFWGLIPTLS